VPKDAQYQREDALRLRINAFLSEAFGLPEADYYERLDTRRLLRLKVALSDINNALTLRLTLQFVAWVERTLNLDQSAARTIRDAVLRAKPSSNGFDIYSAAEPVPFIAEVKCNIPINGGSKYGAAQGNAIVKDVKALLGGKSKVAPVGSNCLRFLVFLDVPEVRAANAHLRGLKGLPLTFLASGEIPDNCQTVYGVYLPLSD
jgi:hypothetical protein